MSEEEFWTLDKDYRFLQIKRPEYIRVEQWYNVFRSPEDENKGILLGPYGFKEQADEACDNNARVSRIKFTSLDVEIGRFDD